MLLIFRERGREGEREWKKHRLVAFCTRPDWGLNPQPMHVLWPGIEPWPFSVWNGAHPTEPHPPGPRVILKCIIANPVFKFFFKSSLKGMFIDLREREKHQRERKTSISCFHMCPHQGSKLQPRYMHWLGIKPTAFLVHGHCSNQLSHWPRPSLFSFYIVHNVTLEVFRVHTLGNRKVWAEVITVWTFGK